MSPFVSLDFSRCLPAWMPGTALWVDGFICLSLSLFICLPLSPSLDAWHGSLGGRVHLSPFVSLHLSPVASQPGCLARLSGWAGSFVSLCLPSFVWHGSLGFVSLHLSPVVSQPGCLARLSRRTDSLVSLCLPSFVSRCLPAWMPGTALWVDSFTCLPLSPFIWLPLSPSLDVVTALQADGFTCLPWFPFICLPSLWVDGLICLPLSPFICLPLSPSLDASLGGRIHLSPFVSLCLSPVVSQPGCPSGWTDSFVSRCLPAWMCGTHAPRFPSLPAVLSFWRGLVCLRLRPWLRSCGCWGQGPLSALHLDFDFAWARGGSASLSIVGYTLSVRSVPRYQLRPLSVLARMWSPELTRAVRCGARLQLREGSVNSPVKQT